MPAALLPHCPTAFCPTARLQQVCSSSMSFDLPAAALAASIEELGTAAEIAASKGDAPVNVFNELGGQGELVQYLDMRCGAVPHDAVSCCCRDFAASNWGCTRQCLMSWGGRVSL